MAGVTTDVMLDVRSALGFEVLGADGRWHSTPIVLSPRQTLIEFSNSFTIFRRQLQHYIQLNSHSLRPL